MFGACKQSEMPKCTVIGALSKPKCCNLRYLVSSPRKHMQSHTKPKLLVCFRIFSLQGHYWEYYLSCCGVLKEMVAGCTLDP